MEQRSSKHGPLHDEALKHDVEGVIRGGHSTHAEEWSDPEPSGEDQPQVDRAPDGDLVGGVPPGMTEWDVEIRSALASHLAPSVWPADRAGLLAYLSDHNAPDELVRLAAGLPADQKFANVQDVMSALGLGTEAHRF